MTPISTSCVNHAGRVARRRSSTWDGKKWVVQPDRLLHADNSIIKPMIRASAEKYAAGEEDHQARLRQGKLAKARGRSRPRRAQPARPFSSRMQDGSSSSDAVGERHRGDLQPRHPRAEGRFARRCARAASSRCWAPTARARPPRCKAISNLLRAERGEVTKGYDHVPRRAHRPASTPSTLVKRGVVPGDGRAALLRST